MLKYTTLFLLFYLPLFLNAQSSTWSNDSASKKIRENDCNDRIFTHVEQPPSLKIKNAEFEDTLSTLLKSKQAFHKTDKIIFKFIVTTQSQMFDLTREFGQIEKENIVKEALMSCSNFWLPAMQNGHPVCSYVRLEMTIQKDKLYTKIVQ